MSLFQLGRYTCPDGRVSHYKIECDELGEDDWATLARLAAELLPPFSAVEGVPRGGVPFAEALEPYCTVEGALLIADDVWVTGRSMTEFRGTWPAFGVVAFARGQVAEWVTPLIQIDPRLENLAYDLESR